MQLYSCFCCFNSYSSDVTWLKLMCFNFAIVCGIVVVVAFSVFTVGWHQEEYLAYKTLSDEMLARLSVWREVQMVCIWSS